MLDSDQAAFIQAGVSISLAAAGPDRMPTMSRGLGCKALDGPRQVAVFVKRSQSAELLDCIRATGRVANVFSLPSDNRTVQIKGGDARVLAFEPVDLPIIEAHIDEFVAQVVPLGMPERIVRAMFVPAASSCSARATSW